MKNLKKKLVLITALAATLGSGHAQAPVSPVPTAIAQPPKSPEQQANLRARYLTKELGLTADQQARLAPILLAQLQNRLALQSKRQAGGPRQGLGQEMKTAQTRYNEQIRGVLTPEQFLKFEQLRDEQREKLRARRANGQFPAQAPQ